MSMDGIHYVGTIEFVKKDDLEDTYRGDNGFGSTGK